MKTTWKIVFAFFLLLPLAGCEEECNSVNEEVSDPAVSEPIRFWYRDIQGDPISINPDNFDFFLTYRGEEFPAHFSVIKDEPILSWSPSHGGDIILLEYASDILFQDREVNYIIRNRVKDEEDKLIIELNTYNVGDCDEEQIFTFFYNGIEVLKTSHIEQIFAVDKN